MQQITYTQYTVNITSPNSDFLFYASDLNASQGWDDASVLALVSMFRGFPWPASYGGVTVSANKNVSDSTYTACTASTNPPAFN
jgi:hypothetical protein